MGTKRIPGVIIGLALQCTVAFTASAVPLTNGDFSAGFAGWKGEVTDIVFLTTQLDPPPGAFTANFDASTGAAVLTTTTLVDDIFSVLMFQAFDLPSIAPGETLEISYEVSALLSDPDPIFGDLAFAQLNHGPGFSSVINLLGTSMQDITALAGQTVELLFGVEDFDGGITCFVDCDDVMTVDNVAIQVIAARVPEPATLGLLGFAVVAAGAARSGRRRVHVRQC
jgi:hypothetical protein